MPPDTPAAIMGGNAKAELKRRVDRRIDCLDRMAELQEEMKGYKAEDKNDGFTEKAITDAVKLRRADADVVLATLMLEQEKGIYRAAAGVPTDIAAAQKLADAESKSLPDLDEKKKSKAKRGGFN